MREFILLRLKALHILDLRTAVTQAYVAASLSAPVFTDPTLVGVRAKGVHVDELRAAVVFLER